MAAPRKSTPAPKAPTAVEAFEEAATEFEAEAPTIEEVIASVEELEPAETPEQARIRELREALAAEDVKKVPVDGVIVRPAPAITAEEKMIRDLEDQLARKKAANVTTAFENAVDSEDAIHIHFIRDGFTAGGEVWFRGQEVVYDPRGEAYAATQDRLGNSWVDLAGDTAAQYLRFGDEYFRPGPFIPRPGEVFNDAIATADARRAKAAPITRL